VQIWRCNAGNPNQQWTAKVAATPDWLPPDWKPEDNDF
jgi:hypothetical protein